MKGYLLLLLLCLVCVGSGIVAGWFLSGIFGERAIDRTIAVSWGDGKFGKNFYGAQVYVIPDGYEYSVRVRVIIGPGNGYYHNCEEIGRATIVQDAANCFGTIRWEENGLKIGDPAASGFRFTRTHLESHR